MGRILWCLKQLLPFEYRTTYTENGERHFTVWRMWFGRCFHIDDVVFTRGTFASRNLS
jgi:hypothetical protein